MSWRLVLGAIASSLLTIATLPAWAQPKFVRSRAASPTVTANQPSQRGLTVPSLWWAAEQFGDKLLVNWSTYPATQATPKRVEIVVRREVWRLLDYVQRYAFASHFGTVASDYGYNVQVVDREKNFLAAYTCDFSQASPRLVTSVRDAPGPARDHISQQNFSKLTCQLQLNPSIL